ncbi:MAG: NAD+ synthase [Micrococcales bacterium]|nr:NAD+ synthase [Micrococcales bacterium]
MTPIKVAFAQTNPVVGDLRGNLSDIRSAIASASGDADVVVFGELALSGYPLGDLSYRSDVIDSSARALNELVLMTGEPELSGVYVVVGHVSKAEGPKHPMQASSAIAHNSASVIKGGKLIGTYHKQILPNFDVFDDWRNFVPGESELIFQINGTKCAVAICQDIWTEDGSRSVALSNDGVELLLVLNGSPYTRNKAVERRQAARDFQNGFALAYSNLAGGQDELVFDGGSFLLDATGTEVLRAGMEPGLYCEQNEKLEPVKSNDLATLWQVLVIGLRDYCAKTGQTKAVLGLSGGIDSALSAAIACEALGNKNVVGIALPSRYSSEHSVEDAYALAKNLDIEIRQVPIDRAHQAFETMVELSQLASENLQARIRAVALMAISNSEGHLLLTTGNKSEIAVGYSTMYGDSAGGFAPIKDVFKTDVWALARWVNSVHESAVIPISSIEKPPSAELRPDQLDSDSLPDYQLLDEILKLLIEKSATIPEIEALGFDVSEVARIEAMVRNSEWKRSQGAIGTKTTEVSFGTGRRVPLTTRFTNYED